MYTETTADKQAYRTVNPADLSPEMAAKLPDRLVLLRVSGRRGRRTLARLIAVHGELPTTLVWRSSDEEVYVFKGVSGQRLKSVRLGPGLRVDFCFKVSVDGGRA
jgi:hypothetical protein